MSNRMFIYFLPIVLLVACSSQPQQPTIQATDTPTPTLTPSPTSTITPTPTSTPTPTPLPMAGPITENVMTRLGKGWVNDLNFSPNGKILSVATSIGVYLYQVETMGLISFLPSNGFVKDTTFIDDETLVVGANDGTTNVWDIKGTPILLKTLQRSDPVVSLAITNENTILVVEPGDLSGPVNVIQWDRANPENVNVVASGIYVFGGTYSPAKNLLALGTWQNNIILIDTQKMKTIVSLCGGQCSNDAFAFSPTGEMLATQYGYGAKSKITLWDTSKKEKTIEFITPETYALDLAFSVTAYPASRVTG